MARLHIKEDSTVQVIREHCANLMASEQPRQLVRSCFICIERRKGLFTHVPSDTYTLEVNYVVPPEIIVNQDADSPLFVVEYRGKSGRRLEVVADSHEAPFQLYFDPNQVLDCRQLEADGKDKYDITCSVSLYDKEGKIICNVDTKIALSFSNIPLLAPRLNFEPSQTAMPLVYDGNNIKPFLIGHIVIAHPGTHLRCPSMDMSFEVSAWRQIEEGRTKKIDDLIFLVNDDANHVEQTLPRVLRGSEDSAIVPLGKDGSDFTPKVHAFGATLTNVMVNQLNPGRMSNDNRIRIPLFWDMSKTENPADDEQVYQIQVKLKYWYTPKDGGLADVLYNDQVIRLKRNRSIMNLNVTFSDSVKSEFLINGCKPEVRIPDMINGIVTRYTLTLVNTAEYVDKGKEDSKIYIKGFHFDLPVAGLHYSEKPGTVMNVLFSGSENISRLVGQDFVLPIKSSEKFTLTYDHTCIDKILASEGKDIYEKTILIPVAFEFYVDASAEYQDISEIPSSAFQPFNVKLQIRIRKEPKPEWLCVDFGTSAVVASYGGSAYNAMGQRVNPLLSLRQEKQRRLRSWFRGNRTMMEDDTETNDNLISSTSVVNMTTLNLSDDQLIQSMNKLDSYTTSHIQFSPSSGMIDIYSRMLPSLKTLMGNKELPKELLPTNVSLSGTLTINRLFELIYKQFFHLFLPDIVSGTNKLVMTIPNTYAPVHVNLLRQIAMSSLKELRPDYLRFMSESDAVAFYYLSKRTEFIRNTEFDLNEGFDENVLVYDMGAGTLDLTYYTRRENGEKYEIEILGKMGVSRAGNYLDYLLAEIVVSLMESHTELPKGTNVKKMRELLELKDYKNRDADAASKLKKYVRDDLKPMLNEQEETALPPLTLFNVQYPTSAFTIGDVLSHDMFRAYLSEVSSEVFTHFSKLFDSDESGVRPRLVIFSGRTTCLRVLREAVASSLRVFDTTPEEVLFLNLADGKYSRVVSTNYGNVGNLKTAVVDGAFAFCTDFAEGEGQYTLRNKNVYAQYGVMFKIGDQGWVWEKLIDTHTQPVDENEVAMSRDGIMIYQYDSRIHDASERDMGALGGFEGIRVRQRDFTGISAAYILQSYSSTTDRDWPDNLDRISVIGHVDLTNVRGRRDYSMNIDSDNMVHFCIGSGEMALLPHDGYTSESFKKSMWPIVR